MLNWRYEKKSDPLAPPAVYHQRLFSSGMTALGLIAFSWILGIAGYHYIAGIPSWIDSIYNSAMILGGMGPVDVIQGRSGKIFASCYAIYSGVMLLTSVGIFLSPALHRLMHLFHLETDGS